VVFEENIHPNGSKLHSARIIPFRGSWVEFSIDINHICYVHIDKKKKFPATALLRAFGYGMDADIYRLFFTTKTVNPMAVDKQGNKEILGNVLVEEIVDRETSRSTQASKRPDERVRSSRTPCVKIPPLAKKKRSPPSTLCSGPATRPTWRPRGQLSSTSSSIRNGTI
jgi:DNA-directed RNA polymerase subunit beta